jgi:lysophospholipase L1-like esterase
VLTLLSILAVRALQTQTEAPYAKDIASFKLRDQQSPPALGQDLFIGSSSFTRWTDMQDYFPKHAVLNRAFGGSTLPDVIRYVNDVVFPYHPKQVIIYCGENDFAADPKLAPEVVLSRFKTLFQSIRHGLRKVPIVYVSMKPSPSRWALAPKFKDANREIQDFLSHQRLSTYVDVWPVMLTAEGLPKPEIFGPDHLHMNADGYHLWAPLLEPILK